MICVPIFGRDLEEVRSRASVAAPSCDLLELRLDLIEELSPSLVPKLIGEMPLPVVATNRAPWEGGAFKGGEEERIAILEAAVESGARYVDVEFATKANLKERIGARAKERGARVILSHHDFEATPAFDELKGLFDEMSSQGQVVVKMVTFAQDVADFIEVFRLYPIARKRGVPLIAFCMGRHGCMSRIASLELGAHFTFASLESGLDSAPGQIPARQMREILSLIKGSCES
ncbi:MAG: type I 3-dehydroquinate dehydratase [Thermodesulfobacteria bacterium]|nr:type I 3-dehydroquinate dehydratase [Thermodesulfobacteriota bacterium]